MDYELAEIKKIRKQLGLTQMQLAKAAQVSQSLLAKIESGKIDPTFTKTKRIFQTLHDLQSREQVTGDKLMNKKLISVAPADDIKKSIHKMKQYGISQVPVIDDHKVVGIISESILLESLLQNKGHRISDVMREAPPIVSRDASIDVISNLLKQYPMVIVAKSGKLLGVITKADLLGALYTR